MTNLQYEFIDRATEEATRATHPFPQMAACEAALESNYGTSKLASQDNNLFGMKAHSHAIYGTVNLPTREFENGEWVQVTAKWEVYPDWASCFFDRLATLQRLSNAYPHYKSAIDAQNAVTYIREVSATWSTDPQRADKVLAIYNEYGESELS